MGRNAVAAAALLPQTIFFVQYYFDTKYCVGSDLDADVGQGGRLSIRSDVKSGHQSYLFYVYSPEIDNNPGKHNPHHCHESIWKNKNEPVTHPAF